MAQCEGVNDHGAKNHGAVHRDDSFFHYLPYSKEDEKLGMLCTTAGAARVPVGTVYPPKKNEHPPLFKPVAQGRVLPEFQVVYVASGQGVFESGGAAYRVKPGSILLVLPGVKHSYQPLLETGWQEYWVGFKGDYFSGLVDEGRLADQVFFELGPSKSVLSLYSMIFEEVSAQRPLFQMKACAAILSIIAEVLARERRKDQPNFYQQIVEKAKHIMESNIFGRINLTAVSDQLGISTSRLNEIFKAYTSMTPYQYYIQIKIHKAESVLERKDLSVKEAAYKMGFDDPYYFSRLFKNKTGVSPSDWKKFVGG
ncbi:MAG: AraC family transcriptional regulator [Spirochaetes bacterium]|nr:AraC family transcriptional regulator [Spirochaetota bacterium]